jgi:hypothetical protein
LEIAGKLCPIDEIFSTENPLKQGNGTYFPGREYRRIFNRKGEEGAEVTFSPRTFGSIAPSFLDIKISWIKISWHQDFLTISWNSSIL